MKDLFYDNRGYVGTLFQIKNTNFEFVEDRISKSKYGVIRGFHAEKYAHRELSCIYGICISSNLLISSLKCS